MTQTGMHSAYDNIRDAVISLGMEISEPILASLADSVVIARLENKERLAIIDPVLLGLEAVASHIDAVRAASDPQAFNLLNDLLDVYREITTEVEDDLKAQKMASDALRQVLEWQNECMLQPREAAKEAGTSLSTGENPDIAVLLQTVQQEIADTLKLADQELAAVQDVVLSKGETDRDYSRADGSLTTAITDSVDEAQQALQQEIITLRRELGLV